MSQVRVIDFANSGAKPTERYLSELPDRVFEGNPHHTTEMHFESPDNNTIMAGTWTSTPGKWHCFTDRDEFCYFISGHAQLVSEDGTAQTFKTGDAFLIPNGFRGHWNVIETTKKYFVIRHVPPA